MPSVRPTPSCLQSYIITGKGNLSANASYGLYLESKQVPAYRRDGIAMPRRQNSTQCRKVKVHLGFPEILTKRTFHTAGGICRRSGQAWWSLHAHMQEVQTEDQDPVQGHHWQHRNFKQGKSGIQKAPSQKLTGQINKHRNLGSSHLIVCIFTLYPWNWSVSVILLKWIRGCVWSSSSNPLLHSIALVMNTKILSVIYEPSGESLPVLLPCSHLALCMPAPSVFLHIFFQIATSLNMPSETPGF